METAVTGAGRSEAGLDGDVICPTTDGPSGPFLRIAINQIGEYFGEFPIRSCSTRENFGVFVGQWGIWQSHSVRPLLWNRSLRGPWIGYTLSFYAFRFFHAERSIIIHVNFSMRYMCTGRRELGIGRAVIEADVVESARRNVVMRLL